MKTARSTKNYREIPPWPQHGRVMNIVGTLIEAHLHEAKLGEICSISIPNSRQEVIAEVVGFKKSHVLLMPYHTISGCSPGNLVKRRQQINSIPVGDYLLGQVVDPFMNGLGGRVLLTPNDATMQELDAQAPDPLLRPRISDTLSLGIRAMDGLLTMGKGQRLGIMAGSGVGKSVLMGMIARNSSADINVIGLIGERGREVREFIERDLGPEGLKRSVVVAVTSDRSPLTRVRGAKAATAIAEHFAGKGKNVLLMMDSVTRVAMAQREIGNAIGEPPTTKGYTPSVFSLLPQLLERTGTRNKDEGCISALYTVLVDGDDFNDPIADSVRSILDGHINLSRRLANKGHFPAIDITSSTSRVMHDIVSSEHWKLNLNLKNLISTYQENLDLIQIGAYQQGTNPLLDVAIAIKPQIDKFLIQGINESSDFQSAVNDLNNVLRQAFAAHENSK